MIATRRNRGVTLIELLVVILIIGILAAVALPTYVKSVETTKADDAVAMVNMIGTTNRMFALDHANTYVVGDTSSMGGGCGGGVCPNAGPYSNFCVLVFCKYLADQNFGAKPYNLYACNGAAAGVDCGGNGAAGSTAFIAGAHRKSAASPYSSWGYTHNVQGVITKYGTDAPSPTY